MRHGFSDVVRSVPGDVNDLAGGDNRPVAQTDEGGAKLERIADGGAVSCGARQRQNSPRKGCGAVAIFDDAPVDDRLAKTRAREIQH